MPEKVLIVEDEEALRESLKRVLAKEGYEISTALDAETALEMMGEKDFDLVLTDVILPEMSGLDLLHKYRKEKPNATDAKVIVMTAYHSAAAVQGAIRSGACDYILKPLKHDDLKQAIRKALDS